jgi:CTP synthase (UTP-ammonia lyase)
LVRAVVVTVLIDSPADHRFHRATLAALGHASEHRRIPIDVRVVPTDAIGDASEVAAASSAVIIGPGSPYRDPDAAHEVVRQARERNIPLVGT